jgi:23S rRNA (adenine2030-N6)-methyltransferase
LLSYRHGFHAGNFADVLKHAVLTNVLEYMTRKEKGLCYIDTHSGAGMYSLQANFAQKTGEYLDGIAKIYQDTSAPEQLKDYLELISESNNAQSLTVYPGSPGIAKALLRKQDSLQLFELHPSDAEPLSHLFRGWRKANVHNQDGYQGALSLLPPPSRRGVMLIDPPYELKTDYQDAVQTIIKAYQKFASGTYLLWYPVVKRELINQMFT